MGKKYKLIGPVVISVIVAAAIWYVSTHNVQVLNPQGTIAEKQRSLIVFTTLLSLLVVIPVFALTFGIAWKYRASNTKAEYKPDLDGNKKLEALWWGIPIALIMVLAVVAWRTSHELDPFRPMDSAKKPLTIQVVALEWKWLFIYPEQNIATVNYIEVPTNTPINFEITADAPMNSFWIPQLGGQIYAMAGMQTELHLMAENPGDYTGSSANLSGEGFAGMKFMVHATSDQDFQAWTHDVKGTPEHLGHDAYDELAKPSKDVPKAYYASRAEDLYDSIMMKYMEPGMNHQSMTKEGHY